MPRSFTALFLGTQQQTFPMASPRAVDEQSAGHAGGFDRHGTSSYSGTWANPRWGDARLASDSRAKCPLTSYASISVEKVFYGSSTAPRDSSRVLRHQEETSVVSRSRTVRIPAVTVDSTRCWRGERTGEDESGGRSSETARPLALTRCDVMAILLDAWPSVFPAQGNSRVTPR
jgi:hypothetical protein